MPLNPAVPSLTPALAALLLALAGAAQAGEPAAGAADHDDTAPAAHAPADPARPLLSVNGFGTFGYAHSDQHGADYVFDNLQPQGTGRNHQWSSDVDSRLGVQFTANFTPQLQAVVQVLSEYRWNNSYQPFINWANLKYSITPNLSVRAGRIALASFLASDSRRVGYSNVTARPPIEVYRLLALKESDGVDASYRVRSGDTSNTTSVLYGKRTVTNTRGVDVHSSAVMGVFDTLEHGPLTLHAAYQQREVDNQKPPRGRFMSLGAAWDPGDWFTSAEWVRVTNYDAKGIEAVRAAWYVNAGVRVGNLTPYATVSALKPLSDTGAAPIAQHTYAAGVRWDAARNLDFKLQWDQLHLGAGSYGTLQSVVPGTPRGGQANVVSALADFIF
jgi:opacity protein-like surface antigen